jgi:hypothetical protein
MTSDAMATGQTLYVLGAAGVSPNGAAIGRAWAFLVKTQQKDGSWVVKSRAPNGTPRIISHYSSGWAALGLIRTLPAPRGDESGRQGRGDLCRAESGTAKQGSAATGQGS